VAAIAFGQPVVPLDGNVERVTARVFAVEQALPAAKPRLTALAQGWMKQDAARARPGDFAQALFDLGATICTPRRPACALCTWRPACAAHAAGLQETLPVKAEKRARPLRQGAHFLLSDSAGRIMLRRRPPKGLLGGMLEVPGAPWRDGPAWTDAEALPHAPAKNLSWLALPGIARHGFTHFELEMRLFAATLPEGAQLPEGEWLTPDSARVALPTVMKRLLALAWTESPRRGRATVRPRNREQAGT
jgi:A/G-specific adenine glycosylase